MGKSYNWADIQSAHGKQKRKHLGEGGVVFTELEQEILGSNIPCFQFDPDEDKNAVDA